MISGHEYMELHAVRRRTKGRKRAIYCAVPAMLASLLALLAGNVQAGNVQFSTTAPAVVDTDAVAGMQQAPKQPTIRRGRESVF